jgi:hypothetical protein
MDAVTPRPLPLPRLLAEIDAAIAQRRHGVRSVLTSLVRQAAATITENPSVWCGGSIGRIAQAERAWLRLDEFVLFVIRVETDLGSPIKPEEWSDLVTSWAVGYGVDHTVGELAANRQRAALKVAREAALALNVNPAEPGTARLAADLAGGAQ